MRRELGRLEGGNGRAGRLSWATNRICASDTLRALLAFHREHADAICQPVYDGHARHPVFLPRRAFEELKGSRAGTLKDFLKPISCPSVQCPMDDSGLALDLDTPEDYEKDSQVPLRKCMNDPEAAGAGAFSRRTFLKGLGTTAVAAAAAQTTAVAAELEKANAEKIIGPGAVPVTLKVNGRETQTSTGTARDAARRAAELFQPDRRQGRLRPRGLRRLHGAAGRPADLFLPETRHRGAGP